MQSIRQGADEIAGLRHVGSVHQFFFRGFWAAVTQVAGNGAGKQPSFLLHIGNMIPQVTLCHLQDISAIQPDRTAGGIVEPEDQRSNRGFAAAGTADNGRRLPSFTHKIQMAEGIFFCIGEAERNIAEGQHLLVPGVCFRVFVHHILDLRRMPQHARTRSQHSRARDIVKITI